MNYKIALLAIFFLPELLHSQSLTGNYNSTAAGRSISLDYSHSKNTTEVGVGIGFNINNYQPGYRMNEIYYKKLHAEEMHEYFAFKAFVHKSFFVRTDFHIYGFYDLQLRYSGAKSQLFSGYGYDSSLVKYRPEVGILYHELVVKYGPYFWMENTIGIGIDIYLSDKFFLRQKYGAGMTFIFGKEKGNVLVNHDGVDSFVGYLINIGLGYRIK